MRESVGGKRKTTETTGERVQRAVREEDTRRVRSACKTYLVIKSLKAEVCS